jgi:hypothetical protein
VRYRVVFRNGLLGSVLFGICLLASSPRGLVIFVILVAFAFHIQRLLSKIARRSGISRFAFFPTYASAGNAFQQLQVLAEPHAENVIQEKAKDEADQEDDGETEDEASLENQLQRIRRGDRVDRLRVPKSRESL